MNDILRMQIHKPFNQLVNKNFYELMLKPLGGFLEYFQQIISYVLKN